MYFLPKEEFTLDQQVCGQDGCTRLEKEVEKEEFLSNRVFLYFYKREGGASLVAQWLRVCLPMQGTRVRALVWEDPTCRGATGPVSHNY